MDRVEKLNKYQSILQQIVEKHAKVMASDRQMDVGWDHAGRAHDIVFHLRIKDGKVWIEWDGIEYGIAHDLLEAGIPKEDIVMAFYEPTPQPLTELVAA